MFHDLRYAARILSKQLGFLLIAVFTLALGIGANTAIFSVADALLWKPVPLPNLHRLVSVLGAKRGQTQWDTVSAADYLDWKSQNSVFEGFGAYQWGAANISAAGTEPEMVTQIYFSADLFETLGAKPALGRTFLPEEEQPGRDRVVVLSHALWLRKFGPGSSVIGKTIKLDGQQSTIVGVMAPDFDFPMSAELWSPLALTPQQRHDRKSNNLFPVARLKPGVSEGQALAQMVTVARRLEQEHPQTNQGRTARVMALREFMTGDFTPRYTWLLLGAVAFVLLIACANVANLQFARAAGRVREIAVRSALGAGRWRVIRQLLVESTLISLVGAVLGVLMAGWGVDLIRSNMPPNVAIFIPGWKDIRIDTRTLGFTVAVALLSGILSGLVPALHSSRPNLNETLKEGGRGTSAGRGHHRLRNLLVISEVALAMVLLVGAALMVKGFAHLLLDRQNFGPETLLTMRVALSEAKYREPHRVTNFFDQVLTQLETLPGVQSAAFVSALPQSGRGYSRIFTMEGKPVPAPGQQPFCNFEAISPRYFKTLRIPLHAGREFSRMDAADALPVAMISERMARRFWPGEDPLGKRLKLGDAASQNPWIRIVGVVGDVTHNAFDKEPRPTLYLPQSQTSTRFTDLAIRTSGDPMSFSAAVQARVHTVDAEQPVFLIKTMERLIDDQVVGLRYVAVLMAICGLIALVLAAVGVYGVMAYSVTERTHEIGLRVALGAQRNDVVGMVMKRGMLMTATGLGIGLAIALVMARVLSNLLFGVTATDPVAFGGILAVLMAVAIVACYIPARKAAGLDPIVALRYE